MPDTLKIAIKVGITSTLRLRGVKAYRAITIHELTKLIENDSEIGLIVIEKIYEAEYEDACRFIRSLVDKKGSQRIMFYTPDNDDITTGVADLFELDIYLSAKDLYRSIKINYNTLVDPDLTLWADVDDGVDDFGNEFDTTLGEGEDTIESDPSGEEAIESDQGDKGAESPDQIEEEATEPEQDNGNKETEASDQIEGVYPRELSNSSSAEAEPTEVKDKEPKPDKPVKEVVKNKSTTVVIPAINVPSVTDTAEKLADTVKNVATVATVGAEALAIASLKKELDSAREENTNLKKKSLEALKRAKELALDLSKATATKTKLEARIGELEANAKQSNSNKSEQTEALEAANAEKAKLQNELAELKQKIYDLESQVDSSRDEIASLKIESIAFGVKITDLERLREGLEGELSRAKDELSQTLQDCDSKVKGYEDKLADNASTIDALINEKNGLSNEIEQLKSDKQAMESDIEALKSELNNPEKEAKHSQEINRLSDMISRLQSDLDSTNNTLSQKTSELSEYRDRAKEAEEKAGMLVEVYNEFAGVIYSAVVTIASLENSIDELNNKIYDLESANIDLSGQINHTEQELHQAIADADKRVELAKSYTADELAKYKKDASTYKTQLDFIKSQLDAKEVQYNTLVQTTGFDESGANALLEHNKTLEVMNTNLMKQLADTKRELDKTESARIEQSGIVARLKDQNHQLSISLRAMTSTVTGGANTVIPPISYTGRGFVIPVIGSGSFGITTTAMSMAMSLASQSRVMYIDFDMVSAKADSWFKMNPIVKNIPGIEGLGAKASGIGLFIEKGSQFFYDYISSIVNRSIKTKGGCVDYLSGLYTKPDTVKLVSADFAGLFNYCGGNYDYVIVDFGRIGCSDINDQIIQLVSEISHRTVVVTPNDKLDIRNTRFAINKAKLNIQNISWLINLSESTKLDELSKNSISPAKNVIIPFMPDFYGQKRDFTKEKPSRDKFNVFLNECVIHR